MATAVRFAKNPILGPNPVNLWEQEAAFNGCPIVGTDGTHMLYRAQSIEQKIQDKKIEMSTIGHAISFDRVAFLNRRQLITPTEPWEQFGCEDPRVSYYDGEYYIFYTAISNWPPRPEGISVALATTRDFFKIDHKHHITPFNAKAMTMFPELINGKIAVILTANCDIPPSTIGIAYVNDAESLWNHTFWQNWYKDLLSHEIKLLRTHHDHVEIGAPPLKTPKGWLLIYSYIKSYLTNHKFFGIEAALLDLNDPTIILSRTTMPILYPELEYELQGKIPNVIFPSGAILHNNTIGIYYGAADTSVCLATIGLDELIDDMK